MCARTTSGCRCTCCCRISCVRLMCGASAMSEASPAELMRLLRGLLGSGALRLELDFKRLDHLDCPVAVEADSNVWIYAGVALCAVAFWLGGVWIGAAAVAACLLPYVTAGRRYVHRRLR